MPPGDTNRRRWRALVMALGGLTFIVAMHLAACSTSPGGSQHGGTFSEATPLATPVGDGIKAGAAYTGDPEGRTLQLSETTVTPGEIITRTISGANNDSDITDAALMLERFEHGSWQTIYYISLLSLIDTVPGPNVAIPAVGLMTAAINARIPDIPPGAYRVRQDMSRDSETTQGTLMTLYATIHVVAP